MARATVELHPRAVLLVVNVLPLLGAAALHTPLTLARRQPMCPLDPVQVTQLQQGMRTSPDVSKAFCELTPPAQPSALP